MNNRNSIPRVFVVSEPRRHDPGSGQWKRAIDLRPAQEFGELVFCLPPNNEAPQDPAAVVAELAARLVTFTADDFLLPVGSPLYIAWASVIATQKAGGTLKMLHWQQAARRYAVVAADFRWALFPIKTLKEVREELNQ